MWSLRAKPWVCSQEDAEMNQTGFLGLSTDDLAEKRDHLQTRSCPEEKADSPRTEDTTSLSAYKG